MKRTDFDKGEVLEVLDMFIDCGITVLLIFTVAALIVGVVLDIFIQYGNAILGLLPSSVIVVIAFECIKSYVKAAIISIKEDIQ